MSSALYLLKASFLKSIDDASVYGLTVLKGDTYRRSFSVGVSVLSSTVNGSKLRWMRFTISKLEEIVQT